MVRGGQIPLRPGIKTLIEAAHRPASAWALPPPRRPTTWRPCWKWAWGRIGPACLVPWAAATWCPTRSPRPMSTCGCCSNWVCRPADCIALEDSDNGLRAALAAGIRTYITRNAYTRGHRFEGAAAVSTKTCRTCRASAARPACRCPRLLESARNLASFDAEYRVDWAPEARPSAPAEWPGTVEAAVWKLPRAETPTSAA
jgi:hypothetical protein